VTQPKCKVCGWFREASFAEPGCPGFYGPHDFDPEPTPAPKPARSTITVLDMERGWTSYIEFDGVALVKFPCKMYQSEQEARAAAQAYIDELIEHFRNGG